MGDGRPGTVEANRLYFSLSSCRFRTCTSSTTGSSQVPVTVYR